MASKKSHHKYGERRGRGRGNGIEVDFPHETIIVLTGPKESLDRAELESKLIRREYLGNCDEGDNPHGASFMQSGMTAETAYRIAWNVPWVEAPEHRDFIVRLDVIYRNPPGHWKWWASIRDDVNRITKPGDPPTGTMYYSGDF